MIDTYDPSLFDFDDLLNDVYEDERITECAVDFEDDSDIEPND